MRRGIVVGIVAAAAVVVAAGGIAWFFSTRPAGPDAAARQYLDALAAGDGAAALNIVEQPVTEREAVLAAFDGATALIERPSVGEVAQVGGAGDAATASVTFRLDGEERSASLSLTHAPDGWRIAATSLGAVTATTSVGDSVSIGDATLAADEPHALLPAQYPVRPAPRDLLEGSASVVVLPIEPAAVDLTASIAPAASDAAQAQLDAYLASCTEPAPSVPASCGIRIPWQADLTSAEEISYRIEKAPTLTLSGETMTFEATDGVLVATVRGMARSGGAGEFTYRTDSWALYGTLDFTGGVMTLVVR